MPIHQGNVIMNGATFHLDDATFIECTHIGSILIYSGGSLPKFEKSKFEKCQVNYRGPADKREEFILYINNSGQFVDCNMSW
ncbi:hypothetical protein ERD95_20990 [Enterobacteriaceae bacterium ML5]|nr:hypothetical protein ERD95_20990 [Enterobacteriaceae bacterium ML5]